MMSFERLCVCLFRHLTILPRIYGASCYLLSHVSDPMQLDREIVGKFIDASVNNHAEAKRLLNAHPQLRIATWLGDESVLNFLAIENFPEAVRFCVQNGFDPNEADGKFGTTPLHYACKLNYPDVAMVLLQHGANPDAKSEVDDNPIHCCVRNGNAELLDVLISHGADPRYVTDLGETVFDNWPNDADKQSALGRVLDQHKVTRIVR